MNDSASNNELLISTLYGLAIILPMALVLTLIIVSGLYVLFFL
ncbi:MAG: hypothetical protein OQL19_02055 [Gammaproteobacteria bacterium]|nr:hypothetical protein [Gammaproteobacteria bacterium]